MKRRGHYCRVCGEYKANEKFSGKGHASHICKKCSALPLEERNQQETLTKLSNLPWRLSREQINWLKKKRVLHGFLGDYKKRGLKKVWTVPSPTDRKRKALS